MNDSLKGNFQSDRSSRVFNSDGKKRMGTSGRPHGRNGGFSKNKDKQRGMVNAFVQGKGQNAALKWLMDSKTPVSIFLITGVKFEGLVSSFDAFTISITDVKHHQQMIYKDKISTITVKKQDSSSYHGSFMRNKRAPEGSDQGQTSSVQSDFDKTDA